MVPQPPASLHSTQDVLLPQEAELSVPAQALLKSDAENATCSDILALLQSSFVAPVHALRGHVLDGNPRLAHYFNVGAFNLAGRRGVTQETSRHLLVIPALNTWLQRVFPSQTWTSICINHNEQLALHRDLGNAPNSLNHIIALGDFTSGHMFLEEASGDCSLWCDALNCWLQGKAHAILEHGLSFHAHRWHASMPWVGDRWAITAYTCSDFHSIPVEDRMQLSSLGFPLPPEFPPPPPPLPQPAMLPQDVDHSLDQPTSSPATNSWSTVFLVGSESRGSLNAAFKAAQASYVHLQASERMTIWSDESVWDRSVHVAFAGGISWAYIFCPVGQCEDDAVRSLHFAFAVFRGGGHVCLDIPAESCIWRLPLFVHFVSSVGTFLVQCSCAGRGALCAVWHFCTSFPDLRSMQNIMVGSVPSIDSLSGCPEFPPSFSDAMVACIRPLLSFDSNLSREHTLDQVWSRIPLKSSADDPTASVDGAGAFSQPDWSVPHASDSLRPLRRILLSFCGSHSIPSRLRHNIKHVVKDPLFTSDEVLLLRSLISQFFQRRDATIDWTIPDGQPYCLHALAFLSTFISDRDSTLFAALLQGVPTGFHHDIPLSQVLFANEPPAVHDEELSICVTNWRGAENDPLLLESLLAREIQAGWLTEVPLTQARATWPNVAVGKMNIVHSANRKTRLVIDSSICGTNSSCYIPERYSLPSLTSVMHSFPLRNSNATLAGCSLDIKAAHKTIRVRRSEQGLLGVHMAEKHFFYNVCPFGATFSAYWFARLGGFILRTLRILVYISHFMALYVDDLLGMQDAQVVEMTLSVILAFCSAFGVPLSWHKLQLGFCISWIGWSINFRMGAVFIPQDKLDKLFHSTLQVIRGAHCDRADLHKVCGLMQWLLRAFPAARPWLRSLYWDLNSAPATNFGVKQGAWRSFLDCINDDLSFHSVPSGMAVSLGSQIISLRHKNVASKADLLSIPLGDKTIWLRIADPGSKRRLLSTLSRELLLFWAGWSRLPPQFVPLRQPFTLPAEAAADAMASGSTFAIGGFIKLSSGTLWFSECYCISDFAFANIPLHSSASSDISCYECLAQIALVVLLQNALPGSRLAIRLASFCDNTGAETAVNKLYSSKMPLAAFSQRLALLSSYCGIFLDATHIAGPKNVEADFLSRWREHQPLPSHWPSAGRRRLALRDLWFAHPQVQSEPPDACFPFQIPRSSMLGAAL